MPLIRNEAKALKKKMRGLIVSGSNYPDSGYELPVKWVEPAYQLSKAEFPGVYLSFGTIRRATNREHRGAILLPYAPEGYSGNVQVPVDITDPDNPSTEPWLLPDDSTKADPHASPYKVAETPIPYDVAFDIAILTRSNVQVMELLPQLMSTHYLPERFGFLEVPEDGTVRTLDLLGGPEVQTTRDQSGEPIYQILHSVSVTAELNTADIQVIELLDRAETVTIDLLINAVDLD